MTESIESLIEAVRREAARAEFPVDTKVYAESGRDPTVPILFAGSLDAALCVVGRDLGKNEVCAGQPLIGAAGRAVRAGIVKAWHDRLPAEQVLLHRHPVLDDALAHACLTNLVPFKPIGNKAYSSDVRRRFRPFLERLLVDHWRGERVITLGSQAFEWFRPYAADTTVFDNGGADEARFERVFRCVLPGGNEKSGPNDKVVTVYPLPHPSPLNRRWFSRFPGLLASRLNQVWT
jgi:uracil-DNA glycosylase